MMGYQEKLRLAKEALDSGSYDKETIEYIFPELKESEDEKIRKEIIERLKWELQGAEDQDAAGCSRQKDIAMFKRDIAWLEKQGDKSQGKSALEAAKEEKVDNQNCIKSYAQEHIGDKVEPKFKNGQWIVWQDKCYKVNYNGCGYELVDQNGLSTSLEYDTIDENAHLWDITQDTKDGDVLVIEEGRRNDECIFIFKSIAAREILEYCYLRSNNTFSPTGSFIGYVDNVYHPATKEQRDLLFQKMKEAGYKWDAEKKELRTIEQSCYHNDGLYYAIDILEKTLGKVEGYQSDDGKVEHQIAIETVNALYHKKPAEWSEEDEEMFDAQAIHGDVAIPCINWLKSLKFKPNHWKPSEEQMAALVIAVHDANGRCHYEKLFSIYNDLKKL